MNTTDPVSVIVVGHNNQANCIVASALFGLHNRFKQFHCNTLSSARVQHCTFRGNHPTVYTAPCLGTPLWKEKYKQILSEREFKNRCFVYVKDISDFKVNDAEFVQNMQNDKETVIIVIAYPSHKKRKTACFGERFTSMGFRLVLLDQQISKEQFKSFFVEVFNVISELMPMQQPTGAVTLCQSVPSTHTVKTNRSATSTGINDDRDMENQIMSVTASLKYDTVPMRPSTPPGTVQLSNDHWDKFQRVLDSGKTISYHSRVNVVGFQGAGKSTLVSRLQQMRSFSDIGNTTPTECLKIDRTASRCIETPDGRLWETDSNGYVKDLNYQRMATCYLSSYDVRRQNGEKESSQQIGNQASSSELSSVSRTDPVNKDTSEQDKLGTPAHSKIPIGASSKNSTAIDDTGNTTSIFPDEWSSSSDIDGNIEKTQVQDALEMYIGSEMKKNYFTNIMCKAVKSPLERRYVSYWDFAGQATYYTTHQAFLSPAAVYLLVVDLSRPLNDKIKDSLPFRRQTYQETTVLDAVRFWAGSIKSFATDSENNTPPIIVVGTHADKFKDDTVHKIDKVFEDVKRVIGESDLPCIAVDNTIPQEEDERLQDLRDRILDNALGIFEKEVPANWINLEYMVILEKDKGELILSISRLQEINRSMDRPLDSDSVLEFLEHEHCNGFLLYFNSEDFKEIIILEPDLLVDFINSLLKKCVTNPLKGWCSNGTFDRIFLDQAVKSNPHLHQYKDKLLSMLIHLKIVYPMDSTFFMPCLLLERPTQARTFEDTKCEKSPRLRVSFPGKLVPPSFFHTLVVSLLHKWEVDSERNNERGDSIWQVYYHYSRFRLSSTGGTLLEMSWSQSVIVLQFVHLSKRKKLIDMDCLQYLETIRDNVQEILRTYRHDRIKFNIDVKCPHHDSYIPLFELLENGEARCSEEFHMVEKEEALSSWIKLETDDAQKNVTKEESDDLPKEILSRNITAKEMVELSGKIRPGDYTMLFVLLGIDKVRIEQIEHDSKGDAKTTIFELLNTWSKSSVSANVGTFLSHYRKLNKDSTTLHYIFTEKL